MDGGLLILTSVDGETFFLKDFKSPSSERKEDGLKPTGRELKAVFQGIERTKLDEALKGVWETGIPEKVEAEKYHTEESEGWWTNYIYRLPSGEVVCFVTT